MIRVGRRIYDRNGKFKDPSFENFENIFCLTKCSEYGSLSPYCLKNKHGHIMENIWQFSKIYEKVPKTKAYYSRYDKTVIWEHPEELHLKNNLLTNEYIKWREKGMKCEYPVRYPVGFNSRHTCLGSISNFQYNKAILDPTYIPKMMDYITARKNIYLKIYTKLVKRHPDFDKLLNKLKEGKNILIIEIDGPHEEDLEYYKTKYGVGDDFIIGGTILATEENMDIMLNDEKFPFGHGYALSISLAQELKNK